MPVMDSHESSLVCASDLESGNNGQPPTIGLNAQLASDIGYSHSGFTIAQLEVMSESSDTTGEVPSFESTSMSQTQDPLGSSALHDQLRCLPEQPMWWQNPYTGEWVQGWAMPSEVAVQLLHPRNEHLNRVNSVH